MTYLIVGNVSERTIPVDLNNAFIIAMGLAAFLKQLQEFAMNDWDGEYFSNKITETANEFSSRLNLANATIGAIELELRGNFGKECRHIAIWELSKKLFWLEAIEAGPQWSCIRNQVAAVFSARGKIDFLGWMSELKDEVAILTKKRVSATTERGNQTPPTGVPTPPSDFESVSLTSNRVPNIAARTRLRPAETAVLEVIAESKSRITCQQIVELLKKRSTMYGESTVKAALGILTTLDYIDNRQDVAPPGYAAKGIDPGIDCTD